MPSVEIALQAGALGILALMISSAVVLGKLVVPAARDFLLGLVAELKATRELLAALTVRVELAEERIKAHVSSVAEGVEDTVRERASRTGQEVALTVDKAVEVLSRTTDPNLTMTLEREAASGRGSAPGRPVSTRAGRPGGDEPHRGRRG